MVTGDVSGRDDAVAFDQLVKFLGRAFERHAALARIGAGDANIFAADAETKVGSPFDVLGRTGKRETEFSELFDVHVRFRSQQSVSSVSIARSRNSVSHLRVSRTVDRRCRSSKRRRCVTIRICVSEIRSRERLHLSIVAQISLDGLSRSRNVEDHDVRLNRRRIDRDAVDLCQARRPSVARSRGLRAAVSGRLRGRSSPAAARMPICRIPPPRRFRQMRASSIKSFDPSSIEPTGAPSPFDRVNITESQCRVRSATDRVESDRRVEYPRAVHVDRQADARAPSRRHRRNASAVITLPPAKLCVFSRQISAGRRD